MPKFMRDSSIVLIEGGVETYLMALYGMTLPSIRQRKVVDCRYAPIMGLLGASIELIVKACVVQAYGHAAMYKDGNVGLGVYRFGNEIIDEMRKGVRDDVVEFSFLWKDSQEHSEQQKMALAYLSKFRLMQDLRAKGLHAGQGCSRDIAAAIANDIYEFIQLLCQSKKLKAYLRNVPAPEATVRDREAILEDLSRRIGSTESTEEVIDQLKSMYIVLPYIPETEPSWLGMLENSKLIPPSKGDVSYLIRSLEEAHSIYLLKNRGGKEGVPVKVEPNNPLSIPIAIQNIKRTLQSIPDQFHNDVLTANTRLEQNRLDLPIDDFVIDLYAVGLVPSKILESDTDQLTAQQAWPFVASAISTQGTPRPCWFIVNKCNEIKKLSSMLIKASQVGNGYMKRRIETMIKCLNALEGDKPVTFSRYDDRAYKETLQFGQNRKAVESNRMASFTPNYIRKYPMSDQTRSSIGKYMDGSLSAGKALSSILHQEKVTDNDKKAAAYLLGHCINPSDKDGLVSVMRTDHLPNYVSVARKQMFLLDFYEHGPKVAGVDIFH